MSKVKEALSNLSITITDAIMDERNPYEARVGGVVWTGSRDEIYDEVFSKIIDGKAAELFGTMDGFAGEFTDEELVNIPKTMSALFGLYPFLTDNERDLYMYPTIGDLWNLYYE